MCRDITLKFTCTATHPSHKMSFSQPCPKAKPRKASSGSSDPSSPPSSPGSGFGLSLTRSISRALERKPDPAVLRAYTLTANRPCEACEGSGRKITQPPPLKELAGGLGERHTLSVQEGERECEQLCGWVEML
ncbi:hypothetical protein HRR83_005428 [Exophiala dermatitidis]|nr:hypothetical protein HRR74_005281 [Exophiala dermatitidis]KAJ4571627.1 hypothetical protein HRR81_005658 [Exophiala dermatitidis]KAJ4577711.1 hypothetical protein HRR79_001047 [Exophiala dermatitidis]KAJ4595788.1 hypothetical protein HRR83_005428 [Exophiala dermatitidis]KAJ4632290.1 hypothetical protein HRR88_001838 [Exophiala dermatitidis]